MSSLSNPKFAEFRNRCDCEILAKVEKQRTMQTTVKNYIRIYQKQILMFGNPTKFHTKEIKWNTVQLKKQREWFKAHPQHLDVLRELDIIYPLEVKFEGKEKKNG